MSWRDSRTVRTRRTVEPVRAALAAFLSEHGADAPPSSPPDGLPVTVRGEYTPPGRLWVRVSATCTVRDDGRARRVTIDLESTPVLWAVVLVVAGFAGLILAAGALDLADVAWFAGATVGWLTVLHWIGAGLVLRRDMRELSRRAADGAAPRP